FLEDPPYLLRPKRPMDGVGFALMTLWIATFQIVLDKGQEADWFGAVWIRWATLVAGVALVAWIWWELRREEPIVELRLLRNNNFANATFLATVIFSVIYGTTVLLPVLMQDVLGYTAFQSGWAMTPRGLGSFLSMLIVGRMMKRTDPRFLIGFGLLAVGITCWLLGKLTLDMTTASISWPLILNGLGA